jgi:hypothetical protein
MFKFKRTILLFLIVGFGGGGDHSQSHDRHPSQSKVRKWSTFLHRRVHSIEFDI